MEKKITYQTEMNWVPNPASCISLKPMVGVRPSLFRCISEAYSRDLIIPLLVHLRSLQLGPDHPSSGASMKPGPGPAHLTFLGISQSSEGFPAWNNKSRSPRSLVNSISMIFKSRLIGKIWEELESVQIYILHKTVRIHDINTVYW